MEYRIERIDRGIKARCEDIYALLSLKEIAYLVFPRFFPVFAILIIPLLRSVIGEYWEKVFFLTCNLAILSISLELLLSIGLISLGQALFFGAGAYFSAIFNNYMHLPVALSIIAASVCGGIFCSILIFPASRLRGIYFTIITLCLPLFLFRIIEVTKILGGTQGISLSPIGNYYLEMYIPSVFMLTFLFGIRRLMGTDYGIIIRAIKDNEFSVMASGINVYAYKFAVILISATIGSFSGAYTAHFYQFVGMSVFSLDYSIIPLTCVLLGGSSTFGGSVLGAFLIVPVSEALRIFGTLRIVIYSAFLILVLLLLPEGIFHYIQRKYHKIERWKRI